MSKQEAGISPLHPIDTSFARYVARRKTSEAEHMDNGVPDYAFALDYELRSRIMQIPHFYSISRKITESIVAREIQRVNQQAIFAGPSQFPEIYQMGVDCAKRLGIGIPNIYIMNSPEMNAYTIAADDASPLLVLYSGIVERMTPEELKAVIAHECGHIHNNHAVLKTVVNAVFNSGAGTVGAILSVANRALMQLWTRAGEVTADRASMICAGDFEDVYRIQMKFMSGGMLGQEYKMDYAALRAQLEMTLQNPSRFYEIATDHPSGLRRLFSSMAFSECEVLYKWRPDRKQPEMRLCSKLETDEKCKKFVNIWKNK